MSAAAPRKPIRVLVVEDSPVARDLLVHILQGDPRLAVAGTAADGVEAIEQTRVLTPDVVTMDIHMPRMDGLEATRRIMERTPTPIVVVSASSVCNEVAASFRIIEAGALAMVGKPRRPSGCEVAKLLETIRLMAEVKVVRRWPRVLAEHGARPADGPLSAAPALRVVAMGASTGGPLVLRTILAGLDGAFPVPIAITQHITPGFAEGFAHWLARSAGFPVSLAGHHETLAAGRAYVAPDGVHLGLEPDGCGGCRALLDAAPPENGHRPAVSHLFRSVAAGFGSTAAGVLLSGMGRDGAAELKQLRERGGVTIVQDLASAVVPGMPKVAIELGAATRVLAPADIAAALRQTAGLPAAGTDAQQSR